MAGFPYHLHVASPGGPRISYPEPLYVTAAVGKGLAITGVGVSAVLTDPNGDPTALAMTDSGAGGDAVAGDGIYTATVPYAVGGTYSVAVHVDNDAGSAAFTRTGTLSPTVDGMEPVPPPLSPITENFTRAAFFQVEVQGVGLDDHQDTGPGTPLTGDNGDLPGMIDGAGDTDCFTVDVADPSSDLSVRVTDLGLGMDPLLEIFDPATSALLATGDLESNATSAGYLLVEVPVPLIPDSHQVLACVSHRSSDAGEGIYRVSAGPAIVSDDVAPEQAVLAIPTLGEVGLLVLSLLLAALGATLLVTRRLA